MNRFTQNMILTSARYAPEREYWTTKLAGEWSMSRFPTDRLHVANSENRAVVHSRIEGETYERLSHISNGSLTALYMELLVGITYLLHRYTGHDDIVVGMPGFQGNQEEAQSRASLYALRTTMQPDDTGKDMLLRIKEAVTEARKNRNIPYELIKDQLQVQEIEGSALFSTVVAMRNLHEILPEWSADICFIFDAQPDRLDLQVEYDTALYQEQTVEQIVRHLGRALDLAFGEINRQVKGSNILLEDEYQRSVVEYNDTKTDYPRDKALHQLFVEQAVRTPHKIALLEENGSMTYQELHEKSNQCARYLLDLGVQIGDRVALIAYRNATTIVHLLGILKAGAAYVPIEPDAPEERKEMVLQNSGSKLILEADAYVHRGMSAFSTDDVEIPYDADRLAYVLYTSGSTGVPKGAAIAHYSALNTVWDINSRYDVTEQDRMIAISSLCFDLSVYDLFGTFALGASLVLIPSQRDIPKIVELVNRFQVTIWNSVPAIFDLASAYLQEGYLNHDLRLVMLSGDWIPVELHKKALPFFPNCQMVSLAGLTEVSIWSMYHPIDDRVLGMASIPFGKPMANQQCYVLDRDLMPCPYGVEGEMYIGGYGLAIGYFNDEERTRQSFIEHPVFGRIYKTGDHGIINRDGFIEMRGRKDFQIKIRGYRIETKEIQVALLKHAQIQAAAVKACGEHGKHYLTAYIVGAGDVTDAELREFLSNLVPDYMIPTFFVRLEALPLSSNGKVDLKALPDPEISLESTAVYEAPRNELEEKLALIWQEVLGVERIGVHDNFFSLGGDSLKALWVINKLAADYLIEINDMFEKQTISELAEVLVTKTDNVKKRIERVKEAQSTPVDEHTPELEAKVELYKSNYRSYENTDLNPVIEYEHILLTGGTGYLGAHLVKQLMESTSARLTLVVRGRDQADAEKRFLRQIDHYHTLEWFEAYRDRVEVLQGDVSQERLGLEADHYTALAESVDCIINSAGNVKHYGPYDDFYGPNVESVIRVIEFAKRGRQKDINHISTIGLASGTVPDQLFTYFTEYDRNVGQVLDSFYHMTKMEAEELLEAARAEGLRVNLFRMGNLVFESHSGKFQSNIVDNAFYAMFRSALRLGIVPEQVRYMVDFTFIDYASKAVVNLFNRSELRNELYHIVNPDYLDAPRLTELMAPYFDLKRVPLSDYLDALVERYGNEEDSESIQNILIYIGIFNPAPTLTTFRILGNKTNYLLERMGFEWPTLQEEHIRKMVEYNRSVGFY